MKSIANFRGFRKVEAFIVTVGEGDGTESSPYAEVEYLILDEGRTVINLTSECKIMEDHEKRQIQETDKEKSKLDTKETVEFIIDNYGDALRRLSKT